MTTVSSSRRGSFQKSFDRFTHYLIMTCLALIILIPIIMVIFGGLKTRGELATSPFTPPNPPQWQNWAYVLSASNLWGMMLNSIWIMTGATVGTLVVCTLTAFVFARMQFRGKSLAFNILAMGLLFPLSIAILPLYLLLRQLGLLNIWGVILPMIAYSVTINTLILRSSFATIPTELQDAAYIDGCNTLGFFWRILLPLTRPSLAAVAVLVMVQSWNEYFLPLLAINDEKQFPLTLGTMQFMGQYTQDWTLVLSFVTLTMIPVIVFYLFAERQIVSGLTAGALKG